MITPSFLATLRRQHRAELVLTLVQLEQLTPGWWVTLTDLAEQLGTDRASLNRTIRHLERSGLLRRLTRSKSGGTWIWWVKRSHDDRPNMADAPRWVLRDLVARQRAVIIAGEERSWAAARGIPYATLRSFLTGHQASLRGRWQLIRTPLDEVEAASAFSGTASGTLAPPLSPAGRRQSAGSGHGSGPGTGPVLPSLPLRQVAGRSERSAPARSAQTALGCS